MRYFLPLIALCLIGFACYGEIAFFHDYAWEDDTSWFFFLFSGVAVCLLCKANFKLNLVATLFSCFCILAALWVLFSALLVEIYYFDTGRITEFKLVCALISHFSLLLTKPFPLFFLVGLCFCLRFKFLPVLCIPFLLSGWLVGWLDGWDYRTFIVSSSFIIVLCSLATILDAWWLGKPKRNPPGESRSEVITPSKVSSPVEPTLPHSRSSTGKSSDQTRKEPPFPEDFSPPPCI
jgi:hypothetical protein